MKEATFFLFEKKNKNVSSDRLNGAEVFNQFPPPPTPGPQTAMELRIEAKKKWDLHDLRPDGGRNE